MEAIRKGNDFGIEWAIFADQEQTTPYDLTGRNLTLYVSNQYGYFKAKDFTAEGNIVRWTFLGKDQKQLGIYTLTIVENEGQDDMHTVDFCKAFRLVARSCEASQSDNGNVKIVYLQLSSSMSFVTSDGSIPMGDIEGYMPMMREFSDDFNDDFAR